MSDTPELKPVTAAELQQLVDRASSSPTEKAKLQSDPEAVLTAMGRAATPSAIEFLRTLGETAFSETPGTPTQKDPSRGMGEI